MKLNKKQVKRMDSIHKKFKLDLKEADIDENAFEIMTHIKDDEKSEEEKDMPRTQIFFSVNGIEIRCSDNLKNTEKVMMNLMEKFGKVIPSYIG